MKYINKSIFTIIVAGILAETAAALPSVEYGFTGQANSLSGIDGVNYHRARYYDPEIGVFISRDPIGIADNLNTYTYAGSNPTNITDPTGEFGIFGAGVGALLGGLGAGVYTYATTGNTQKALRAGGIGAVTGALVGSGVGLVAGLYQAGSVSAGAAIASSGIISGVGSGVSNASTQVALSMVDGNSASKAVASIDRSQVVTATLVGGVMGTLGGGLSTASIGFSQSNAALQTTMSSNLISYSRYLTQNQGASSATVGQVQNSIMNGMAALGRNSGYVGTGVSAANDVVSPLFSPYIEAVVSPHLISAAGKASDLYGFYRQSGGLFGNESGVLIDKAATLIESNLADIKGATYDPVSKQIIFLGSNTTPGVEGIDMDYFYTAVKSVYGSAAPPAISLDAPAAAASLWQDFGDGDGVFEANEWGGFSLRYNPLWSLEDANIKVRIRCTVNGTAYDFAANFAPQTVDWLQFPNGEYPMHLVYIGTSGTAPPGIGVLGTPFAELPYGTTHVPDVSTNQTVNGGQDWIYPFQIYNGGTASMTNFSFVVIPDRQHRRFSGRLQGSKLGWVLQEADRIMKCLAIGKDNVTGATYSSATLPISGYKNLAEINAAGTSVSGNTRVWFLAEEMAIKRHAVAATGRATMVDNRSIVGGKTEFIF